MPASRAIVSVKATKGGSGSSGVARYNAGSKRDEEREGRGPCPLFNGKAREKLILVCGAFALLRVSFNSEVSDRNGSDARHAAAGRTALRTVTPKGVATRPPRRIIRPTIESVMCSAGHSSRGAKSSDSRPRWRTPRITATSAASASGKTAKPAPVGSPNSTSNAAPTRAMRHVYEQEILDRDIRRERR